MTCVTPASPIPVLVGTVEICNLKHDVGYGAGTSEASKARTITRIVSWTLTIFATVGTCTRFGLGGQRPIPLEIRAWRTGIIHYIAIPSVNHTHHCLDLYDCTPLLSALAKQDAARCIHKDVPLLPVRFIFRGPPGRTDPPRTPWVPVYRL